MPNPTRSHHRVAGALQILLLASICASAQRQQLPLTRTMAANAKVESKTGDIIGKVVSEIGQPLANASVWARPATPQGLPVKSTTTNRDGVFKFSGLEPGSYSVSAAMPSYIPKSPESNPPVPSTGDTVTLILLKAGVITGTVTN